VMLFGSDVARAIANAAEAHKATMIVMGFSVKGTVSRLLGGDLCLQLLKISPVPVLIHPPQWTGTV
jgi:nucleotide-binding universal stress UspA family protein